MHNSFQLVFFYLMYYYFFHLNWVLYIEFQIRKSLCLQMAECGAVQNSCVDQTFASISLPFSDSLGAISQMYYTLHYLKSHSLPSFKQKQYFSFVFVQLLCPLFWLRDFSGRRPCLQETACWLPPIQGRQEGTPGCDHPSLTCNFTVCLRGSGAAETEKGVGQIGLKNIYYA